MSTGVMIIEDRYLTGNWICSLPVQRKQIVKARYFSALMVTGAVLFLYLVYGLILKSLISIEWTIPFFNIGIMIVFSILPALSVSILLPFVFRYGFGRGVLRMMTWFAGFLFVLTLILHFSAYLGDLIRLVTSKSFLAQPLGALMRTFSAIIEFYGIGAILVFVMVLLAGMVSISMRLSIRFFNQQEF